MAVVWAHPFQQGNKRTGFAAAEIFFRRKRMAVSYVPISKTLQMRLLGLRRIIRWRMS